MPPTHIVTDAQFLAYFQFVSPRPFFSCLLPPFSRSLQQQNSCLPALKSVSVALVNSLLSASQILSQPCFAKLCLIYVE